LALFNLERVISTLNIKLRTPLLPLSNKQPWQFQTLSNTFKLGLQLTLIKARMQRYIDSLPISIVAAFEKVLKGAAIIAHKLVLA
jgi:hypothetical protein